MREILFRGQTRRKGEKVNLLGEPVEGKWAYGGILLGGGDFSIIYTYDAIEKKPVYTDTVGQYIGLKDKQGAKIFEGDIVKAIYRSNYTGVSDTDFGIGVIEYDDTYYGGAAFKINIIGENCSRVFSNCLEVEVIGNIHENPELLKGVTDA